MFTHAPKNYLCPFCLIIQGVENKDLNSVQSDVIYHDNRVTAFLSLHQWPNNHGSVVIVPNEHFENIFDLPDDYAIDIHRIAQRIALAMKTLYLCDGISTRQHNEPGGNQDVWHYHLHIAPRYKDDNYYSTKGKPMEVNERAQHAKRYIKFLSK
jgi:histidine triad (HIT) family protein